MMIIGSALVSHYRLYDLTTTDSNLKSENLTMMERISRVAGDGQSVEASRQFGTITLSSNTSTAIFKLPAIDSAKNIIAGSYDYIAFYKSPTTTNLFEYIDGADGSWRKDSGKILSKFVSSVIFGYNNSIVSASSNITIFLENQRTVRGARKTYNNSTTIYLKNK